MVVIKQLENADIKRIGEVDRREHVTLKYVQQDGKLVEEAVEWHIPRWATDGSGFSTQVRVEKWTPILEQGGAIFGALDDDMLCGFSIANPQSLYDADVAELCALFVSRDWRKQGLGRQLTAAAEKFTLASGTQQIFVSSNNSEAAVKFYLSQGYELAEPLHPDLYAKLYAIDTEGIHLIKSLS